MKHSQWRRALLVAAAVASGAAVFSGFLPATSARADSGCPSGTPLEVHLPGGVTSCITLARLESAPTVSGEYYNRSAAGSDPSVFASGTFVDLQAFANSLVTKPVDFFAVVNIQDEWSTWTSAQAAEPPYEPTAGSPTDAQQPADPGGLINGSTLEYYRPLFADNTDTATADDVPNKDPLVMYVGTSPYQPIDFAISPTDSSKLRPGATVTFTVTNANSALTYTWDFGDGLKGASGSTVSHVFVGDCGCVGTVTATSADGSIVGQAQPFVKIGGKAKKPPPPAATSSPPSAPGGGVGPPQAGGPPNRRPGPGKTPVPHPSRSASASASPIPTLSLPSLGQIGPRNPTGGLKPSVAPVATATSPDPQVTLALAGDDGPLVSGQLIGSSVVPVEQPAPVPQNAVAPAGRLSTGGRALVATGSGLVIMLLFAAGIVRERRGTRRRRSVVRAR
jgi:hypothetical protein